MLSPTNLQLPPLPTTSLPSMGISQTDSPSSKAIFGEMLSQTLGKVANQQADSQRLIEEHLLGHSVTDIEVLTAIKEADLALKTMIQVRNKTVEAYKELKQIQL